MKEKILVVDDDKIMLDLIKEMLELSGLKVFTAKNADSAMEKIESIHPALIILDLMLPGIDGFELTKIIKKDEKTKNIPIIIVSAKFIDTQSIVTGLSLGADDFITKPFDVDILVARVKAILRRTAGTFIEQDIIESGNIKVDLKKRSVYLKGKEIRLTPKEFDLLVYLMKKRGFALDRNTILQSVWEYSYFGTTRTVDVHIQQLRKKIKDDGKIIQTVGKLGYRFEDKK
ncbi:MAG: response regulator transcription factor [Elusimicrobia bacterium]|nr:response regulator transcription factor [Elusimicrobiota bacterium]